MTIIKNLKEITNRGRIQATANEIITPELAAKIGAAYGTYLGSQGIIVVAREFGSSTRMLKRAFIAGLMSAGQDILNLHSSPVPVLQFSIRRFGANAGAYFSSVVSGKLENQIRFYDSSGVEFNLKELESVNNYFKNNEIYRASPLTIGNLSSIPHTQDIYKKAIPEFVNKEIIKNKQLRIVVDCSYGPASIVIPSTLTDLENDVIAINAYENVSKANEMFPNLQSIKDVVNIVKASNSDIGIILDTDGSRAVYTDETGRIITHEELVMFFLKYDREIQNFQGSPIITTHSSSRIIDQFVSNTFKSKTIKTQNYPGEISRGLREERAPFGASDTRKYYFKEYGPFSDSTFTTLKIIEIMSKEDKKLSELVKIFPRTTHAYKSIAISFKNLNKFREKLRKLIQTSNIDGIDFQDIITGTKLIFKKKGWILVSPSIFSDVIDLESEGINPEMSEKLITEAEEFIKPILNSKI